MNIIKFFKMQSVGLAIYALVIYLYNFKKVIGHYNPTWKFLSIKIILILSIWQTILLDKVIDIDTFLKLEKSYLTRGLGSGDYIDNTLVCLEMFALALMAVKNFSYKDFKKGHHKNKKFTTITAIPKIL